jgi:hypothetical protein
MDGTIGFWQRLVLAFAAFFAVLLDRTFAEEVRALRHRRITPPPFPPVVQAPPPVPAGARVPPPEAAASSPAPAPAVAAPLPRGAEALQVLSLLQRDGRLVDFVSESLDGFSDAEIGAAARTVHAGCRKVLDAYVKLEPIFSEPEDARVTVKPGFDPAGVRLTGNVVGSPPFEGSLRHHGWRAVATAFPALQAQDPHVLAPAEVEL